MIFLLKGILIGIIIGMPVGPIGAISIRKILTKGPIYGLISGLGACVADAVYGFIVAFGLTFLSDFFVKYQMRLRLFGSIVILLIGLRIYISQKEFQKKDINKTDFFETFISTFILAITNPATIFTFTVIFAALGLKGLDNNSLGAFNLIFGVFIGGAFWWVLLTALTNFYRNKLNDTKLRKVNKVFGGIIMLFGLVVLISITK